MDRIEHIQVTPLIKYKGLITCDVMFGQNGDVIVLDNWIEKFRAVVHVLG